MKWVIVYYLKLNKENILKQSEAITHKTLFEGAVMNWDLINEKMEILRTNNVVFTDLDGTTFKATRLEVRTYDEEKGYVTLSRYDDLTIIYSKELTPKRKRRKANKIADTNNMKEIQVVFETAKAYAVYDGSNGSVVNPKSYYKYYAKSICIEENGKVYAPVWA